MNNKVTLTHCDGGDIINYRILMNKMSLKMLDLQNDILKINKQIIGINKHVWDEQ